jgi:hypothetical protein
VIDWKGLRVTVIGGDDEGVSGGLTSIVDGLDGSIGGSDSLDSGIKNTSVSDL